MRLWSTSVLWRLALISSALVMRGLWLKGLRQAKEKFQELNEAYEILKDPNERAWYDSHKDQILRGDEEGE